MVRRALRTNLYPLIPFVCASRVLRGLSNLFTLSQNVKVRMALRLLRRDALLVIVAQQLIEEIDRVRAHQVLVFRRDVLVPRLARVSPDERLKVRVEFDAVLVQVRV